MPAGAAGAAPTAVTAPATSQLLDVDVERRLKEENTRLAHELDALRAARTSTPVQAVQDENDRLKAHLKELANADKTRTQMGYEIAELRGGRQPARGAHQRREAPRRPARHHRAHPHRTPPATPGSRRTTR